LGFCEIVKKHMDTKDKWEAIYENNLEMWCDIGGFFCIMIQKS